MNTAVHTTLPGHSGERSLTRVLGLNFLDCPRTEAAELVVNAATTDTPHNIFFVNAHCVNTAARDTAYKSILEAQPFLFADGAGMELAALITGKRLLHNVNGTDLFPLICERAAAAGQPIALIGAAPGIAQRCAEKMTARIPQLHIASVHDGYLDQQQEREAIEAINQSGATILFVAKGVPLQEHWVNEHRDELKLPVVLAVGALFDFYSGAVPRAPSLVRKLRAEWIFRLLQEPRRMFRRYIIGNPEFILRALWFRMTGHAD